VRARLGTLRRRAPGAQLVVTPDGKQIVAIGPDLIVRRFDPRTGELLQARRLPHARVNPAGFEMRLSPRGTSLLLVGWGPAGYRLELWDLARGQRGPTLALGRCFVWGAAFSADERHVAVADSTPDHATHHVRVWDVRANTSRVVWSAKQLVRETFFNPVVALSPDGRRLAACHLDLKLRCGSSGRWILLRLR
jgi:WD40 repeat protein